MTPKACCIEPDVALRAKLASLFCDAGWDVEARDGIAESDGPLATEGASFDLIVATSTPAGSSLLELVARIRTHSESETTPIVVLCAEEDFAAAERAFEAGVTEAFSWRNLQDFRIYLQSFIDDETVDVSGKRLLVLEDEQIQGVILHKRLIKEGFVPSLFTSVDAALVAANEIAFDAVITDLVLGLGQSGVSFIRRLRQSQTRSAHAPVIAISGFEDDARRLDALRAGADSFLPKPVKTTELCFHLRRLLHRSRGQELPPPYRREAATLNPEPNSKLTEREQLICALTVAGHRDKQIAHDIGISYWTVRTHLARVFRKFNITNRVELAAVIRANTDDPTHRRPTAGTQPVAADSHALSAWIMSEIPLGVIVTDKKSRIVHVNRAFCEISGYTQKELLGQTPQMFRSKRHPPELHREMLAALKNNGRWNGSVWNRSRSGRDYLGKLEIRRLSEGLPMGASFVGTLSDITMEHAHTERIREQSLQDPLTGLANRIRLKDRTQYEITRARRTGRKIALAFVDLDQFKPINDTHGHAVGDSVLQEVAARLSARLRDNDTLARIGGDEFVALLPDIAHREAAQMLALRLTESFLVPFGPCGTHGRLGASIGVSLYPEDGQDFDTLMAHADDAMYRAKRAGGGCIACFSPQPGAPANTSANEEIRLNSALENDEFELLFQPQVDLLTDHIIAAEALLRWRNPQRGLLAAADFIPTAERSGSIIKLGAWALRQACAALAHLQRAGHTDIRLSVNVSPLQILCGKPFADDVLAAINDCGIPHGHLELEISEGVFLHNPEQAIKILSALADNGVSLALDGIGKDHFSPGYLRHLPFRSIKIDRHCTSSAPYDPYCNSIVRSSLLLARGIGIEAIAEGVENHEQLAFLRHAGYQRAQGNLLGYPMTLDELTHRLDIGHR